MSCFLLPIGLANQITSVVRQFWWSTYKDRYKIPWIAWKKVASSKAIGGLGFRDIRDFNIALLTKQSWRILTHPESLLTRVYKVKYFNKSSILEAKKGKHSSFVEKHFSR